MSKQMGDRNLLFGILALQRKYITRDALLAAMRKWTEEKSKGMAQILREQHAITENNHAVLEEVVDNHIAQHGHDTAKSLRSVVWPDDSAAAGSLKQELEKIADPEVQASAAHVCDLVLIDEPEPKPKPTAVKRAEGGRVAAGGSCDGGGRTRGAEASEKEAVERRSVVGVTRLRRGGGVRRCGVFRIGSVGGGLASRGPPWPP